MDNQTEYKYNLFLSWTGADRKVKNQIRQYFVENSGNSDYCYDSDEYCKGDFREDYVVNLYQSKVYLLLLTDSLVRNASTYLSEVRKELSNALEYEAEQRLNIVILCLSPYFRTLKMQNLFNDPVGLFYYSHTRSFSRIDADVDEEGKLDEVTLKKLYNAVTDFVKKRDDGNPVPSQKPYSYVVDETLSQDNFFVGRRDEQEEIKQAFSNGAQVVVLSGMGGIGKTRLASEFARISDAEGTCKFFQIVHVQEMLTETSGLRLLVSETRFKDDFWGRYQNQSEKVQYQAKLNALKEIPEYCLLILDNFNLANEDALYELVNQLKCRLLITTRARIETDKRENRIVSIHVDKLAQPDAYNLFKSNSGREISEEQFDTVWEAVKGHTITLCIMASILKKHSTKTVEELVDKIKSAGIFNLGYTVQFEHNNSSQLLDILGHLKALFDVSTLNQECMSVLRNMCLLSDGTISVMDLQASLHLSTDNAIVSLLDEGWLEEKNVAGQSCVYIHPIISQLIYSIDPPTQENVSGIIEYLANYYDRKKENLVYTDAHLMETKLYYAIFMLAKSCKILCKQLWDKFVELNHLLGNLEEIEKQTTALNEVLNDEQDRELVDFYYNFSSLENNPEDISSFTSQVRSYTLDKNNYKRILKMIPVVGKYAQSKSDVDIIYRICGMILPVAYEDKNDLAVLSCLINTHKKYISVKKFKQYLKLREEENIDTGMLLTLKYIYAYIDLFGSMPEGLSFSLNALNSDDIVRSSSKIIRKHPIRCRRILNYFQRTLSLPQDDVMYDFWKNINNSVELFVDEEHFDAEEILGSAMRLLEMQQENDLTLLSREQIVNNLIDIFQVLPSRLQGELQQFVNVPLLSADRITIEYMSRLNIACALNGYLAETANGEFDKRLYEYRSLEQCKQILDVQRTLHGPEHYKVIEWLIQYGNLCRKYDKKQDALQAFIEAYNLLVKDYDPKKNKKYSRLFDVCRAIIANRYCAIREPVSYLWFTQVKKLALKLAPTNEERIGISSNYVRGLIELVYQVIVSLRQKPEFLAKSEFLALLKDIFDKLQQGLYELTDICKDVSSLETKLHTYYVVTVSNAYMSMLDRHLFDSKWTMGICVDAQPIIQVLDKMQHSKVVSARNNATLVYHYVNYHITQGADKLLHACKCLNAALKFNLDLGGRVLSLSTELMELILDDKDENLDALLDFMFGKRGKVRQEQQEHISAFLQSNDVSATVLPKVIYTFYKNQQAKYERIVKTLRGSRVQRRAQYYSKMVDDIIKSNLRIVKSVKMPT